MPLGPRALSHLGPRAPPGPGPSPGPKSVRFIVPGMSFRVRVRVRGLVFCARHEVYRARHEF